MDRLTEAQKFDLENCGFNRDDIASIEGCLSPNPWKAYAIALQNLYDNGGPLTEPALAKKVEALREKCKND
jgi:hypothetical protein